MNEEELKKIWKSSPDEDSVRLEKSRLINNMQKEASRWYEMSKSRNSIIVIVGVLGWIIITAMIAYTTPSILSKIGALLSILSFVYWLIRLINTKKLKPRSYPESYIDYLYKIRDYLVSEKKFYDDILYWCFPLFYIGMILFYTGTYKSVRELMLELSFVLIGGVLAYLYYKKLLSKKVIKRRMKVDELLKVMEEQ